MDTLGEEFKSIAAVVMIMAGLLLGRGLKELLKMDVTSTVIRVSGGGNREE